MAEQYTIFITGGHATPAIAVIEEIQRRKLPWQVMFVGRKYALEGEKIASAEFDQITGMGIPFLPLLAGRLSRVVTPFSFLAWIKIPIGFFQAFWYVALHRPKLVISFGGYLALPVVIASALFGIGVVTHEQTMRLGLANRIISLFAKKIFLSFPHTASQKTVVTGLPLRQELFHPPAKPSFDNPNKKSILYITGGATGSATLNDRLFPLIHELSASWCVIHQTGSQSFGASQQLKAGLSRELRDCYTIAPYFSSTDVSWIYKHADLVISRAGANTVWELAALGKVALLVPLPWSAGGEQLANARWLAEKGSAIVLEQKYATAERLLEVINGIVKGKSRHLTAAKKLQREMPTDGAKRMVDEIAAIVTA